MRNRHIKIVLSITALLVIALLMISGCSKPGFKGIAEANVRPRCYISNIPTEGEEYSSNPALYWYATDEDGFIKSYRYIVKRAEDINDDPLQYAEDVLASNNYDDWTVIFVDLLAPGKSATSDTIPLYANVDPSIYTPQYFFVQAIDNYGVPSQFTDTINGKITADAFRMYSRNNNPPETYINFDTTLVYFSLTDTTALYQGVPISWSGSDSLDYKRTQPPFEYNWQVYGPFDTREEANTNDPTKLIAESYDSTTNDVWVSKQAVSLYDLYRNEGTSTTTRSNYFAFKVRARDDAFVPDPTPEEMTFFVVEPGFEKDILIVDNNTYLGINCVLRAKSRPIPDDIFLTGYQAYYKSLFDQMGTDYDYYWYYRGPGYPDDTGSTAYDYQRKKAPGLDTLLRYKLIINFKDNWGYIYKSDTHKDKYTDYLKLGGKIMFIGWNNFSAKAGFTAFGPNDFEYKFCGITSEFNTDWSRTIRPDTVATTPEEFIWADAIVDDITPRLNVEPVKLHDYFIQAKYGHRGDQNTPFYDYTDNAEPWVNYYIKNTKAEAIYVSKSVYSSKEMFGHDMREFHSIFGEQESIDGRVCGLRYDSGVFKSATFGFSLYCMPDSEAVAFLKSMVNWFYTDDAGN